MEYSIQHNIVVIMEISPLISDADTIMDTILSLKYETGLEKFVFSKGCFSEDFFRLSSGIAGDVIQKFVNYGIRAAVYGDFTGYTSKPLRDFIYESNKGRHFGFMPTLNEAVAWLER